MEIGYYAVSQRPNRYDVSGVLPSMIRILAYSQHSARQLVHRYNGRFTQYDTLPRTYTSTLAVPRSIPMSLKLILNHAINPISYIQQFLLVLLLNQSI